MSLPRADEWTDPGSLDTPPRRGRKGAILTGFFLVVAGAFLAWREWDLRRIPDVGESFDARTLGTVDLPDELNAFTYYREAVAKFGDAPPAGAPYVSWSQAPPRDREWLKANAETMKPWYFGTTMDRALFVQPKDERLDLRRDVVEALPRLARLGQLAGLGMEAQGDFDEAWGWYRAALRSSRHCGKDGGFVERLVGVRIFKMMAPTILAWAEHPNQGRSSLGRALDDLVTIDAMTPTFAENLRAESFALSAVLSEPNLSLERIERDGDGNASTKPRTQGHTLQEAIRKLRLHEPERSRRIQRLVWANWLAVANLPIEERARRGRSLAHGFFYEWPQEAPQTLRRIEPQAIDRWVGSTIYLKPLLPPVGAFEEALRAEAALRASLIIAVAEALYAREYGHRPESPEQLVGPYLKALPEGYAGPPAGAK